MLSVIGRKVGMTSLFTEAGKKEACTVVACEPNFITQVKTDDKEGYNAVQISSVEKKEKSSNNPEKGHFAKAKITPKRVVVEVRDFDGEQNLGDSFGVEVFEEVEKRFLQISGLSSVGLSAGSEWWNSEADKIGGGFIEIAPASERKNSGLEIMKLLNESVNDLPGIFVEIAPDLGGPSFDNPIELNLFGVSQDSVNDAADKVESHMRTKITGLKNITSSKSYPSVEWSVEVDKQKAAQLGVSVADVGALVQMLTNGFKVGEYRPDDSRDEVEIRARFPESDRTITGIQNLNVTTLEGLVPVSSFISVIPKENVQSADFIQLSISFTFSETCDSSIVAAPTC